MEIQIRFRKALELGLKAEFDDVVAEILGDVIGYFPNTGLDHTALAKMRNANAVTIQASVSSSNVNGGTLLKVRSNAIASALLRDIEGVKQWGSIGLEWCLKVDGGGWSETTPEWSWMLNNPEEYSHLVIELKRFLGQA